MIVSFRSRVGWAKSVMGACRVGKAPMAIPARWPGQVLPTRTERAARLAHPTRRGQRACMQDVMTQTAKPDAVTAALLVIGDEILSGRTKDRNIGYIAEYLTALGIELKEVRVVGDEEGEIVGAVNAL